MKGSLIWPQQSSNRQVWTFNPWHRMAWRKRSSRGWGVKKALPPSPCRVCEKLACSCVSACKLLAVRPCTWSREEHARGQGSPRRPNRIGVLPLPKKARWALRLHRTTCAFCTPLPSLPVSPSSLVHLFSFLLWKDAVIHNPLNYRQLNYPSRLSIFSPRIEIQKQLTSSWLGTFPRKGHSGNWMTPQFTFLTMTSLLHA